MALWCLVVSQLVYRAPGYALALHHGCPLIVHFSSPLLSSDSVLKNLDFSFPVRPHLLQF